MLPVVEGLAGAAKVAAVAPKVAEVAVATTKAAEIAAAVPKVAEVATSAPQALAGGLEAGLGDAHATLGHLAGLNTELAAPPIEAGSEASPFSPASSATSTEGATGPVEVGVKPTEGAAPSTPEVITPSDEAVLSGIEKATAEAGEIIEKSVESKISQWDNENPQPNADTDPEKFNEWVRERASAQSTAREDATVNAALQSWDKEHPAPDKGKDPQGFNKWIEERSQQETQLKKEVSKKEDDKTVKEKGGKQELSAAEIAARVKRLQELGLQIADLNEGIKTLRTKVDKTPNDKVKLAEFTALRDGKMTEVKIIKTELGDAVTQASPIKKIALITALVTAAGVMMAAQASKA